MDDLARALRAVLDDPDQLQQLQTLAGSLGLSMPAAPEQTAQVPPAAPPEPAASVPPAPLPERGFPEPAAAMLRQAGRMEKKQEALLLALKPFLRRDRQEKIDRALHAARLAGLAGLALKNRGLSPGAKETP